MMEYTRINPNIKAEQHRSNSPRTFRDKEGFMRAALFGDWIVNLAEEGEDPILMLWTDEDFNATFKSIPNTALR